MVADRLVEDRKQYKEQDHERGDTVRKNHRLVLAPALLPWRGGLKMVGATRDVYDARVVDFRLHFRSGLVSIRRIPLHRMQNDFLHLRRDFRINLAWGLRVTDQPGVHDDQRTFPLERR